jgi:phage terminase large subunit-like protein
MDGGPTGVVSWTGNLAFLKEATVTLPVVFPAHLYGGKKIRVNLEEINNQPDTYGNNNTLESVIPPVSLFTGDLVVGIKTNGMPSETRWVVRDSDGNVVKSSRTSMNPFTLYQDTIKGLSGCYQLQFIDSDDDGISWWANGDGDGFIRAKGTTSPWNFFEPDFGREFTFNFWIEGTSSTYETESAETITITPNPAFETVNIRYNSVKTPQKVAIVSLSGSIITENTMQETDVNVFQSTMDISQLTAGMYLVKIITKTGVHVHTFVKQ